jgi:palmitoyltransferase
LIFIGDVCESFKAPRAHHCKKCGKCVLKLDHHVSKENAEMKIEELF